MTIHPQLVNFCIQVNTLAVRIINDDNTVYLYLFFPVYLFSLYFYWHSLYFYLYALQSILQYDLHSLVGDECSQKDELQEFFL